MRYNKTDTANIPTLRDDYTEDGLFLNPPRNYLGWSDRICLRENGIHWIQHPIDMLKIKFGNRYYTI